MAGRGKGWNRVSKDDGVTMTLFRRTVVWSNQFLDLESLVPR